jgi:PrgI family protein
VSRSGHEDAPRRVRIPADVEREDRLLANLTARQLAILGAGGVVLWVLYEVTARLVPLPVFAAVAAPLAAVVVTLALGRMGGVAADRLALAAWRHHRSPRRLVPAPEGVPPVPAFFAGGALGRSNGPAREPRSSPLTLPLVAIGADGVVDLGSDGFAVLCRASAVSFSLRTATEQEALVAGFGRYLNSLSEPTQILIRAEPIDLGPMIAALERAAPALPHLGLEEAARAHARFLGELAATRDLLRREVLVVLRQRGGDGARVRLLRRAEEATAALSAAGVTLALLAGDEASRCLGRALDPAGLPGAADHGTRDGRVTRARHDRSGDDREGSAFASYADGTGDDTGERGWA